MKTAQDKRCTVVLNVSSPVDIELVVDDLGDGLSVGCRAGQSTVDLVMEGRQLVHHPVHHRRPAGREEQGEFGFVQMHLHPATFCISGWKLSCVSLSQ